MTTPQVFTKNAHMGKTATLQYIKTLDASHEYSERSERCYVNGRLGWQTTTRDRTDNRDVLVRCQAIGEKTYAYIPQDGK